MSRSNETRTVGTQQHQDWNPKKDDHPQEESERLDSSVLNSLEAWFPAPHQKYPPEIIAFYRERDRAIPQDILDHNRQAHLYSEPLESEEEPLPPHICLRSTQVASPVIESDPNKQKPKGLYKHSLLKTKLHDLDKFALLVSFHHVLSPQEHFFVGNTAIHLSQIEDKYPKILRALGYNTGTAHESSVEDEAFELKTEYGRAMHKMRVIMNVAARGLYAESIASNVPTYTREEVTYIHELIEHSRYWSKPVKPADIESHMLDVWGNYRNDALDLLQSGDPVRKILESDDFETAELFMAHHFALEYWKNETNSAQPAFDINRQTYYELSSKLRIKGKNLEHLQKHLAGITLRMRLDQYVAPGNGDPHPYVYEFKTNNPFNRFKYAKTDPTEMKATAKTHREVALRQAYFMMLATNQLVHKADLQERVKAGEFRSTDGGIILNRKAHSLPEHRPQFVYEYPHSLKTGRRKFAYTQFEFNKDQWNEFWQWNPIFNQALKLMDKADRDRAEAGYTQHTLLEAMSEADVTVKRQIEQELRTIVEQVFQTQPQMYQLRQLVRKIRSYRRRDITLR